MNKYALIISEWVVSSYLISSDYLKNLDNAIQLIGHVGVALTAIATMYFTYRNGNKKKIKTKNK